LADPSKSLSAQNGSRFFSQITFHFERSLSYQLRGILKPRNPGIPGIINKLDRPRIGQKGSVKIAPITPCENRRVTGGVATDRPFIYDISEMKRWSDITDQNTGLLKVNGR
jgi:hypothetical protein